MSKVLGNQKQGLLFVISAPAGTGKTTLAHLLCEEFSCVVESISYTTRPPRLGEVHGKHYFFISHEEFKKMEERGDFLETAHVFEHYYGTSKSQVMAQQEAGYHVLLVIDTQGAKQLRGKIEMRSIFISPPSIEILRERLERRKTETEETIQKRLSWAKHEMEAAMSYDYQIVNDDLTVAYAVLRSILIAEEHKPKRS